MDVDDAHPTGISVTADGYTRPSVYEDFIEQGFIGEAGNQQQGTEGRHSPSSCRRDRKSASSASGGQTCSPVPIIVTPSALTCILL